MIPFHLSHIQITGNVPDSFLQDSSERINSKWNVEGQL